MGVTIADLNWSKHAAGGERAWHDFPNGYAASVLRGGPFYTKGGTYEIAVMRDGDVDYTTPITDDVLGYQTEAEANSVLEQIAALPSPEAA